MGKYFIEVLILKNFYFIKDICGIIFFFIVYFNIFIMNIVYFFEFFVEI